MLRLADELRAALKGRVETERSLAPLTTYRLGGPAAVYIEPEDAADLAALAGVLADRDVPVLAMGRGSNLVISDKGWPGVVVRPVAALAEIAPSGGGSGEMLVAGAGVPLPTLANWAARRSLAGLEWAVGVPGALGGGVRMNAGAHGAQLSDVLSSVMVCDLRTGDTADLSPTDLDLSYRHSALVDGQVVVHARLVLTKDDPAAIKERMASYRRHRAETQPGALQNAGSVFKNPPGDSAGRLVEAAGLKGFSIGTVRVSELHANFFIASDGATSNEVHTLVLEVARLVEEVSGVTLEPEIRFAGSFDSHT